MKISRLSSFWQDRLIEAVLVISMSLFYCIGNHNLGNSALSQLNPLYAWPFLGIFLLCSWYRLSFTLALLPLALPYYLQHKILFASYSFSLTEIVLFCCVLLACIQLCLRRGKWLQWVALQKLRFMPVSFLAPLLVFLFVAALSVYVAVAPILALRAFREEVFDPLLYLFMVYLFLRGRQDIFRLVIALVGSGLIVALIGLAQYIFWKNTLSLEADGIRRVHALYGSANSIGLFFDYLLPLPLSLLIAKIPQMFKSHRAWRDGVLLAMLCLPLLLVLYLSQSRGAWVALASALLFIVIFTIQSRKVLLIGGLVLVTITGSILLVYHTALADFLFNGHISSGGVSTVTKRLYLWRSAWQMIHDSPWFGYGMDNWLCHYSKNNICDTHLFHYWIINDPVTGAPTGLLNEPDLSHPHNIFLHIWVSMGIFGLLAFLALLGAFYRLFWQLLRRLKHVKEESVSLRWLPVGLGAALFAVLVQGQVDNAFLEQDLSFCFWILVALLLLVKVQVDRYQVKIKSDTSVQEPEKILVD